MAGQVALGADHEEGASLGQAIQTKEVEITTIHDVDGAGFQQQVVEDVDFVLLAIRDVEKRWDAAAQIQQGVQFDSTFGLSELGPGEQRQTQIDGRGIQGINGLVEFEPELLVLVEFAGELIENAHD